MMKMTLLSKMNKNEILGGKPMEEIKKQEAITQIKKLTEPIFRKYGVEKAYLFGSYARGDYN